MFKGLPSPNPHIKQNPWSEFSRGFWTSILITPSGHYLGVSVNTLSDPYPDSPKSRNGLKNFVVHRYFVNITLDNVYSWTHFLPNFSVTSRIKWQDPQPSGQSMVIPASFPVPAVLIPSLVINLTSFPLYTVSYITLWRVVRNWFRVHYNKYTSIWSDSVLTRLLWHIEYVNYLCSFVLGFNSSLRHGT